MQKRVFKDMSKDLFPTNRFHLLPNSPLNYEIIYRISTHVVKILIIHSLPKDPLNTALLWANIQSYELGSIYHINCKIKMNDLIGFCVLNAILPASIYSCIITRLCAMCSFLRMLTSTECTSHSAFLAFFFSLVSVRKDANEISALQFICVGEYLQLLLHLCWLVLSTVERNAFLSAPRRSLLLV